MIPQQLCIKKAYIYISITVLFLSSMVVVANKVLFTKTSYNSKAQMICLEVGDTCGTFAETRIKSCCPGLVCQRSGIPTCVIPTTTIRCLTTGNSCGDFANTSIKNCCPGLICSHEGVSECVVPTATQIKSSSNCLPIGDTCGAFAETRIKSCCPGLVCQRSGIPTCVKSSLN